MEIAGARILLTGASSGIGAALAPMLAERGAAVALVARREDKLQEVLEACRAHQPDSSMWVHDLADVDGSIRLAEEAWEAMGHLDVVVHNAAMPKRRRIQELTPDDLDVTFRVNFFAPARMTMALLPKMLERDQGVIVNVSSLGGRLGIIHESAYCAAKFALCGWSESLYLDLAGTGVDVRLVVPGAIDTDIWDRPGSEAPLYDGPKEPPEVVAGGICSAIESDQFEWYLPDMQGIAEWKTANAQAFLDAVVADMGPKAQARREAEG